MNIFKALSQGYGRLNEENMSAMLGFLLAPYEAHGMSDIFLRLFLEAVAEKCNVPARFEDVSKKKERINAQIVFEEKYAVAVPTTSKIRRSDVEIRLYDPSQNNLPRELHRVVIENKIHPRAAQPEQFREEYDSVKRQIDADKEAGSTVTMVFLTPLSSDSNLKAEFERLTPTGKDSKVWLYWNGDDDPHAVTTIIREILKREDQAHIAPISNYMQHTLKAFVRHIIETIQIPEKDGEFEVGGLKDSVTVNISQGKYRLELYESSSVLAFNLSSGIYEESTRPILVLINDELKLEIPLISGGTPRNTRSLGKMIIDQLKQMGHQ
jgi:hypothetical protein